MANDTIKLSFSFIKFTLNYSQAITYTRLSHVTDKNLLTYLLTH